MRPRPYHGNSSIDSNNTLQDTHNPNASPEEAHPTRQKPNIGSVVIPYMKGIAESFKKIYGKYGIQTYFRGNTTIKQILMKPKDKDPKDKKSVVIYSYQCGDIACSEEYIGKTSRTLGRGTGNTLNNPVLSMHTYNKQDTTPQATISTSLGGRGRGMVRTIKEAIYLRVNNPTLNTNIG